MIEKIQHAASFQFLRQFAHRPEPLERCELCGAALAAEHQHLWDPTQRRAACACDSCAVLFSAQESAKFKRVPRRIRFLPEFQLSDAQWNNLLMPINLAFFFKSSPGGGRVIAMYPSPAGAMESLLTLDTWSEIAKNNPVLDEMESDVEALLVNRIGEARSFAEHEYYLAPIDECYKLVGLIRTHWSGLTGGEKAWRQIGDFFSKMKAKSPEPATENARA